MTSLPSRGAQGLLDQGHPGSIVWYLSFGDLLTLLLCFFLVLTPWDKLKEGQNKESEQIVATGSGSPVHDGTALASDPPLRGSVILRELPLFEGDEGIGARSSESILDRATQIELAGLVVSGAKVSILVCEARADRAAILRGFSEVFHRVVSEVADFEIQVSASCEGAEILSPMTRDVVGRIRVTRT